MSTSSVNVGDSSDASCNDDSIRSISVKGQLIAAIRAGELENLREILSQEDVGGRPAVKDDDIHEALHQAAVAGSVGACRLLWGKLRSCFNSRHGKKMYFKATYDVFGTLHIAVYLGHFEVVRLFIEEFKWNINQDRTNGNGYTPLYYAVQRQRLEMARFLLENGANVNQGGEFGPLYIAVRMNNTEACRLLLVEYKANPNLNRRPMDKEDADRRQPYLRNTDFAIQNGIAEILRMLLGHGAFVGHLIIDASSGTALNVLLCKLQTSHETKLTICRILIEHAKEDHSTATFMQASFKFAITLTGNVVCKILLDAGIDRRMALYCAIREENLAICQLLVRDYQVDPFLQNDDENNNIDKTAASPFLAAARLQDTAIFEYFLGVWDERFASSSGKNSDGDYPLHVVCCDPLVSLQAIKVLVNHHADALAVVDGEQGLLPFHFAANWGASLDVIFYLLQHCPNALSHTGNAAAVGQCQLGSTVIGDTNGSSTLESTCNNESFQAFACGPVKKKYKTTH